MAHNFYLRQLWTYLRNRRRIRAVLLLLSKVTQKHFRQPSSIKSTLAPCGAVSIQRYPSVCIIRFFSLSVIYRCVPRSCYNSNKENHYHRKFSDIPFLSKYSFLDFSRSSSVAAVFDCVYNCLLTR